MGSTRNRRRPSQFKFAIHKYTQKVPGCEHGRPNALVWCSDASPLAINLLIIFSMVFWQDAWGRRTAEKLGYKIHTVTFAAQTHTLSQCVHLFTLPKRYMCQMNYCYLWTTMPTSTNHTCGRQICYLRFFYSVQPATRSVVTKRPWQRTLRVLSAYNIG